MTQIIKYIAPTQTTAFDLVNHISDAGGNVCMVMNGNNPTRCVLSDYDCASKMERFCDLGVISNWAEDWDVDYFNKSMGR
jgi:hypothetical protein